MKRGNEASTLTIKNQIENRARRPRQVTVWSRTRSKVTLSLQPSKSLWARPKPLLRSAQQRPLRPSPFRISGKTKTQQNGDDVKICFYEPTTISDILISWLPAGPPDTGNGRISWDFFCERKRADHLTTGQTGGRVRLGREVSSFHLWTTSGKTKDERNNHDLFRSKGHSY